MATNEKRDERSRNWVIVFYPESAPADYERIIRDWHVKCFLSPLHEADLNADGTPKKPHYHLLMMFSGKKSADQIQELSDQLSKVKVIPYECAVRDCKAMARYLIHLDNPDKFQYERSSVKSFGGIDYMEYIETSSDVYVLLNEITVFILENGVEDLGILMAYCIRFRQDWARTIMCRTVYINFLLRSVSWSNKIPEENRQLYVRKLHKYFNFSELLDDSELTCDNKCDNI